MPPKERNIAMMGARSVGKFWDLWWRFYLSVYWHCVLAQSNMTKTKCFQSLPIQESHRWVFSSWRANSSTHTIQQSRIVSISSGKKAHRKDEGHILDCCNSSKSLLRRAIKTLIHNCEIDDRTRAYRDRELKCVVDFWIWFLWIISNKHLDCLCLYSFKGVSYIYNVFLITIYI